MQYLLELPDAGHNLIQKFYDIPAEGIFTFPVPTEEFVSTGVTSTDEFPSVLDGDPVVRSFSKMTIQAGHIVRPTNRCKGMYLFVEGDLIVDGELTMTARGAKGPGKYVGIDPRRGVFINSEDIFTALGLAVIHPTGGAGASKRSIGSGKDAVYSLVGYTGGSGINGACGGGGSGGCAQHMSGTSTSGAGSAGTSFSGGAGGGGAAASGRTVAAGSGQPDGGLGGDGRCATADVNTQRRAVGGGAGNPGGIGHRLAPSNYAASPGDNGTGGLLIIVVHGDIIFGPNGKITANGAQGGAGHNAGGGGSGGGAIHIFHKGDINTPAKILAHGGIGGASLGDPRYHPNAAGGNGGAGSIVITKI